MEKKALYLNRESRRGFTLIELLVVIAIIGILSAVILTSLNTARGRANTAQRLSDIREIQKAIELYYADNGSYPVTGASKWYSQCTGYAPPGGTTWVPNVTPTYIPTLPQDPILNSSNNTCCYMYRSDTGTDYKLMVAYSANGQASCPSLGNFSLSSYPSLLDPKARCTGNVVCDWAVYSPGAYSY